MNKRNHQLCMYFLQGRCRFGEKCHYSHDFCSEGYVQALMIRHAVSTFNEMAEKYPGMQFQDQIAKNQFQFNEEFIDCPLSKQGIEKAKEIFLPQNYISKTRQIDIVFVSPLNRTLETADLIIKSNKLKIKKIIVLPQLTEVLSKICDFSGPLEYKMKKYQAFDFRQFQRYLKEQKQGDNETNWQDALVDDEHRKGLKKKQQNGRRYIRILKDIFPTPLQSSQRCFERAFRALDIMKAIIQKAKAKKVIIVSHNRILKYLDGRYNKGRAQSFQNGQIRSIIF